MVLIPAIDLIGGQVVRLRQGDYDKVTFYPGDPADLAADWGKSGVEWIHVVDLEGARAGRPVNLDTIRRICSATSAQVEVGGGIRDIETAMEVLRTGAGRVVFGTALVRNEPLRERVFQGLGERAMAMIDARDGMVAVSGWEEGIDLDAYTFAKDLESLGCRRIGFTDIATDGMLSGPNLSALSRLKAAVRIPIIASGGVATLEDLRSLSAVGVEGAIVGRAVLDGIFSIPDGLLATQCDQ